MPAQLGAVHREAAGSARRAPRARAPMSAQRLGDAVHRAAADRLVAVERPDAARAVPRASPGSSRISVPELPTSSEPAGALDRRAQAHPADQHRARRRCSSTPAPSAAQRVERGHGVGRRPGSCAPSPARRDIAREQRGAVGDRLVGGGRVARPAAGPTGVEARVAAHSSATGKPSSPISSARAGGLAVPGDPQRDRRPCACRRPAPAPCPRCSRPLCRAPAPPGRRYRGGSAR